jgi:hypothetical protein
MRSVEAPLLVLGIRWKFVSGGSFKDVLKEEKRDKLVKMKHETHARGIQET